MNIGMKPRLKSKPNHCKFHDLELVPFDDIVNKCTYKGCMMISVRQDLVNAATSYWYHCNTCNNIYPTLTAGVCTICNQDVQNQWEQLISQVRG